MREHRNDHPEAATLLRWGSGTAKKGGLPSRMMFAQTAGGNKKTGTGGRPNIWLRTLRDNLAVFRSIEGSTEESPRQFRVETVPWVHAANKAKMVLGVLETA